MKKIATEVFILLLVSIIIIFFQFNKVPKKLSWDEVEFTRLALSLDGKTYTPYSQLATGHSTLYFYIILAAIKIFGLNNFALRFPSALFGVINVLIFYFICRIIFTKITYFPKHFLRQRIPILNFSLISLIPFFLSLILISSSWYFNFARFSFEATFLLFLEQTSIYFLFKFFMFSRVIPTLSLSKGRNLATEGSVIRFGTSNVPSLDFSVSRALGILRNDMLFLILSAIFSGLSFLSYYPGRIFFLLPLLFFFIHWYMSFRPKRSEVEKSLLYQRVKDSSTEPVLSEVEGLGMTTRYILIFIFTFILVISPLLTYLTSHQDLRIQEQLFLTDKKLTLQKKISYFGLNTIKLAYMFTHYGDLNGRHNYPGKAIFNPVVGAFFLLD